MLGGRGGPFIKEGPTLHHILSTKGGLYRRTTVVYINLYH